MRVVRVLVFLLGVERWWREKGWKKMKVADPLGFLLFSLYRRERER